MSHLGKLEPLAFHTSLPETVPNEHLGLDAGQPSKAESIAPEPKMLSPHSRVFTKAATAQLRVPRVCLYRFRRVA